MTKNEILATIEEKGTADALELRAEAAAGTVTDTEIIDREDAVPEWDAGRDYTGCPVGTPVTYGGQVYGLNIPHNAAHYPNDNPGNNRTLWGLKHTTNPYKAKPYVQSEGTSGMYMTGECCTDPEAEDPTQVYIANRDNVDRPPHEYADYWTAWAEETK